MGLTILYLLVFGVGTLLLTAFNLDFDTAFSASIANLVNIGPGLGMVGPAGNYAAMPPAALWILLIEIVGETGSIHYVGAGNTTRVEKVRNYPHMDMPKV